MQSGKLENQRLNPRSPRTHEEFARAFADFWRAPAPGRLKETLTEDVILRQPLSRPLIGLAAAERFFENLLAALPDLRGEVHRWSAAGDYLFIDFDLKSGAGKAGIVIPFIDRFHLRNGMADERVAYFDPLAALPRLLKRTPIWHWGKLLG